MSFLLQQRADFLDAPPQEVARQFGLAQGDGEFFGATRIGRRKAVWGGSVVSRVHDEVKHTKAHTAESMQLSCTVEH